MNPFAAIGKRRRHDARLRSAHQPVIALDLGSARTRVWTPDEGLLFDVPTIDRSGDVTNHPVRRGAIVDVASATRLVTNLLGRHPATARPLAVVMTTPVLYDDGQRDVATTVVEALKPHAISTVECVKAAAIGAGTDFGRPLLVIDLGAELTEVALLNAGEVIHAQRIELGIKDLYKVTIVAHLVDTIVDSTKRLLRQDCAPQVVDALDRGPLLIGEGATRPEITYRIARQLGSRVQPAAAPRTAAVRGACALLQSTQRAPRPIPD